MIAIADLNYPIVMYDERSITTVEKCRNTSLHSYLLGEGVLGECIIDSSGKTYVVVDVQVMGRSFAPWHNWFHKDKIMKIAISVKPTGVMGFEKVKEEIIGIFDRHPKWMPSMHKPQFKNMLEEATTIEQLVGYGYADGDP